MKRWAIAALLFLLASLVLGYLLAGQIDALLDIQYNPKDLPKIPALVPESEPPLIEPLEPVLVVVLPVGAGDDPRYQPAVEELAQALATRTGQSPLITEDVGSIPLGRIIWVKEEPKEGSNELLTRIEQESFSLRSDSQGGDLLISANHPLGHVYGIYDLANRLRAGLSQTGYDTLEEEVVPAMTYRLVDPGAVGVEPDTAAWSGEDYTHVSRAYQDAIIADPPYIDTDKMADYVDQMEAYVSKMMSYGYNGIVINGFLEYVDFDTVGDGYQVYGDDSPYRPRQEALRQAFGTLFKQAHEQGMMIILKTDMLANSPPLQEYFKRELGGIDAEDPALWDVYRHGVAELFETFPYIEGLMIRIGEGGAIYNLEGWDYTSSLDVKTITAVHLMLKAFTDVAAQYDKTIFFRTWSVGVGQAGDMHTNPETYQRLLGTFNPPNLVVSTKLVMGDYYSYQPFNPTLLTGEHRRIIEFQARREFEAFSAFPNYMGPEHQAALKTFLSSNPNIQGMWVWTQDGGPWRAGPMSLYPFYGLWQTYDDNVYATSRLGWDPAVDLSKVTGDWIRRTLSDDPDTVANLEQMLALSHKAVLQGLYVGPFAEQQVLGLGVEPPPMLWIFEWDIVSGSSSALAATYDVAKERIDEAIKEGFAAVETVGEMRHLVQETDPATYFDSALHDRYLASLDYAENLFEVLAWWRQTSLRYYQWLDTGDKAVRDQWSSSLETFERLKAEHVRRYQGDRSFPPYNFFAVDVSNTLARRSTTMTAIARLLLVLSVVTLFAGRSSIQRFLPEGPFKAGLRSCFLGAFTPWQLRQEENQPRYGWVGIAGWVIFLIVATRFVYASFLAWIYVAFTLLALFFFAVVLLLIHRRQSPRSLFFALGGPVLLQTILLLAVISIRGPGYLWMRFWTSTDFRLVFITLTVVTSLWLLFSLIAAMRSVRAHGYLNTLGSLLVAYGMPTLEIGLVVHLLGLDPVLTAFNDQMAILPMGLSRILGITTHFDIPKTLALYGAIFGGLLTLLGVLALLFESRSRLESRRT
jgi:hypothetical protein